MGWVLESGVQWTGPLGGSWVSVSDGDWCRSTGVVADNNDRIVDVCDRKGRAILDKPYNQWDHFDMVGGMRSR